MLLVVDANIAISSLIGGKIGNILFSPKLDLVAPERLFIEIKRHKDEVLLKSGLSGLEFEVLIILLEKKIRLVPMDEFISLIPKAENDVFVGVVAHEFAEFLLNFRKKRISGEEKRKLKAISASSARIRDQSEADVLASLRGYRDHILAYTYFRLACLRKYQDFPVGGLLRPPSTMIDEMIERTQLVQTYS